MRRSEMDLLEQFIKETGHKYMKISKDGIDKYAHNEQVDDLYIEWLESYLTEATTEIENLKAKNEFKEKQFEEQLEDMKCCGNCEYGLIREKLPDEINRYCQKYMIFKCMCYSCEHWTSDNLTKQDREV
jgi:hypothetical protein